MTKSRSRASPIPQNQRQPSRNDSGRPSLRFTPYAWAKLTFLRDLGPTEIGGFGISAAGDPLLVEEVRLVRQRCTATTVRFLDEAVADYFDDCVDRGLAPDRFARLWLHTHPGASPKPSGTDEATLAGAFGNTDWSAMFVLAREGATYARLRFGAGPGGEVELPVGVDWSAPFAATDREAWEAEYDACVEPEELPFQETFRRLGAEWALDGRLDWTGYLEEEAAHDCGE